MQSFQPEELRFLGRIHDVDDVHRAVSAARAAGFQNINLDFMFGLPRQSLAAWEETLTRALALAPEHLSLYSLIVEPDTPLHHWVQIGRVEELDEDEAADHYELALALLAQAGYQHYEVSNWARAHPADGMMPVFACRHNLVYWRNQPYLGIGPGAHSHMFLPDGKEGAPVERRWGNHKPVPGYVRRMMEEEDVAAFTEVIDTRLSMAETMMLGLRLIEEGVSLDHFQRRYHQSLQQVFATEISRLEAWGVINMDRERIRLSPRGIMVGNQVFSHFMPEEPAAALS